MAATTPIDVYVRLLGEGTTVYRPTQGIPVTASTVRLLPTPDYNPEIENWEFKPGSVVGLRRHRFADGTEALVAVGSELDKSGR